MEYQISDTESVNSNMSSNVGNCTERLKAPTRVKSKVWVCDEWSRCDSK